MKYVILDTDIGPDCDDAGALAMLHTLRRAGRCELLALTHCTGNPFGAACADAINRYYGAGDIPVGTLTRPGYLDGPECMKYNKRIAEQYENRYLRSPAPPAVDILRKTLADCEDKSVTLVTIGPLSNVGELLASKPDGYSSLSGTQLAEAKIARMVCMGCGFAGPEFNIHSDVPAAAALCEDFAGEVWFSPFEVGLKIITGADFRETAEDDPVRLAYSLYSPGGRQSWDQTAVWAAIMGPEPYFGLSEPGHMNILPDGSNCWMPDPQGRHRYLTLKAAPEDAARGIDLLMRGIMPKA